MKKRAPRKSPYLHPAWIALRNKVKERSKGRCESKTCRGAANADHVHHLRYAPGSGWRRLIVPMKHLIHLCADCHSREHPTNARGQMLKIKLKGFLDE